MLTVRAALPVFVIWSRISFNTLEAAALLIKSLNILTQFDSKVSVCLFLNWLALQDVNQKSTCETPDWETKLQVHWPITLLKPYSLCLHHLYIVVYYCILLHRCRIVVEPLSTTPPNRLCNSSTSGCRLFNHMMLRRAAWCFRYQRSAAPIMKS